MGCQPASKSLTDTTPTVPRRTTSFNADSAQSAVFTAIQSLCLFPPKVVFVVVTYSALYISYTNKKTGLFFSTVWSVSVDFSATLLVYIHQVACVFQFGFPGTVVRLFRYCIYARGVGFGFEFSQSLNNRSPFKTCAIKHIHRRLCGSVSQLPIYYFSFPINRRVSEQGYNRNNNNKNFSGHKRNP